eukprot:6290479-Amphidinium_carterae.1
MQAGARVQSPNARNLWNAKRSQIKRCNLSKLSVVVQLEVVLVSWCFRMFIWYGGLLKGFAGLEVPCANHSETCVRSYCSHM